MEEKEIYLDNSATTKVCDAAAESALSAMKYDYGNADSLHRKGFQAEQLVTGAKREIAGFLHCSEQELFFTSGATESNNTAIFGVAKHPSGNGRRIVTTPVEHASVEGCMEELRRRGYEIVEVSPDADGNFQALDFFHAVNESTILVSAMHVNNETGTVLPVEEIGRAVKRKNPRVMFHVDAVQGFLKLPILLRNSPTDLLTASGHKVHAPKGIGLLYVRKGVHLKPLIYGSDHLRPGTVNVPLISAFGAAVRVQKDRMQENRAHYESLKQHLLARLDGLADVTVNSTPSCAPYIVNLSVRKIRSETMLHYLEQSGIYVSSGSACSKGKKSHVLISMGLPEERVDTALRVSFSAENTIGETDRFVSVLASGIDTLIKMK